MISHPSDTSPRALLALGLGALVGVAAAQGCPSPTGPPAPPGSAAFVECERKGQALFAEYQTKFRGMGAQGAEALLRVQALGRLATTPENANALRALLASRVTRQEKVALVPLLARQHAPNDPTGMNRLIVSDLRQLCAASDEELARAAVFALSRSGFYPDSEAVLLAARNNGVLDVDGYYGEIAHLVIYASGEDQARLVRTLRAGTNRYSADIAFNVFNSARPRFGSAARTELLAFAEAMEPKFGVMASQYDYIEGLRYADWLLALAALKFPDSPNNAAEFVMATVDQPLIDPRKIAAVLISPEARSTVIAIIGVRSRFDRMLEIVDRYPKQHPGSVALRELPGNAREAVATNTR